jgi:hypothetical protein
LEREKEGEVGMEKLNSIKLLAMAELFAAMKPERINAFGVMPPKHSVE